MKEIDIWDYRVIRLFKNWDVSSENPLTVNRIKEIWAERCALDVSFVHLEYINQHFLGLAQELGLFKNEYRFKDFIFNLNPENNWKYICSMNGYLKKDTTDFNLILLSRLDSLFSLTEVKDLPGFEKFHNSK